MVGEAPCATVPATMGLPNIGPGELILILIIALVVLGPGKLPDVASSLGRSVREFRKAATDVNDAGRLDAPSTAPMHSQATLPAAPADPSTGAGTPASAPEVAAGEPTAAAGSPARDPNLS